jgi:peptidyl-prolyl cis-trans isomerase SurA
MRAYLTQMREESYISPLKAGYVDTGASPKQITPVYSAYTPPSTKKKKKVERTRFRETAHSFRQKSAQGTATGRSAPSPPLRRPRRTPAPRCKSRARRKRSASARLRPKTLPGAFQTTEDAGGGAEHRPQQRWPLQRRSPPIRWTPPSRPRRRASAPAPKSPRRKEQGAAAGPDAPAPPDAAEVADRQEQASPHWA